MHLSLLLHLWVDWLVLMIDLAPHLTLMESMEPLRYTSIPSKDHQDLGFAGSYSPSIPRHIEAFHIMLARITPEFFLLSWISWPRADTSLCSHVLSPEFRDLFRAALELLLNDFLQQIKSGPMGSHLMGEPNIFVPPLKDREQDVLVLFWKDDFYVYLLS